MIAFLGSVFSPYYAHARRGSRAESLNHCAFNVALHGPGVERWAMTERGVGRVLRNPQTLVIGPSSMRWDGAALEITIHERCAPIPWPLRGKIRIHPQSMPQKSFALDAAGKHLWVPIAPSARVEASFSSPALKWSGTGYVDSNRGMEPLESTFRRWTWSRIGTEDRCAVLYDVSERNRPPSSLALMFAPGEEPLSICVPESCRLPSSRWRISRQTRTDSGCSARVVKTLLDAPFYSRTLLQTRVAGIAGRAIHESLDLDRLRARWVQCLLPFRMPRNPF